MSSVNFHQSESFAKALSDAATTPTDYGNDCKSRLTFLMEQLLRALRQEGLTPFSASIIMQLVQVSGTLTVDNFGQLAEK
jgi:hypothetical protein